MVTLKQGDIIYLTLDPQAGHEQSGRRPVLVVSRESLYRRTGMALVCPITNTDRAFPLHVPLVKTCQTTGFVMCEQVKSLDLKVRNPAYKDHVPDEILDKVLELLHAFIWEP